MYRKRSDDVIKLVTISDVGEAEYYSDLLCRNHYLQSSEYSRRTIMHVARLGRKDVAIVTWECGTRHWFGKRDDLIGWTKNQKTQRLKYCVENRRFLILEEDPEKNLASHVLSLSVERLCHDAEKIYGHDVMLAETFVDPSRGYEGTCYKAAGWTDAGLTVGGKGERKRSQKRYFFKELKKDALAKLKAPELSASDTSNPRQSVLYLEQLNLTGLKARLESVPDYRRYEGDYPLTSLLALIIAGVLSGAKDAKGVFRWISSLSLEILKSIGCPRAPSYTTVWRVITRVNHDKLQEQLCEWLAEQASKLHAAQKFKHYSLDGKMLRAASKTNDAKIHIVTMIDAISKTIIEQRLTDDKSNEIPKVVEMINEADIDAETVITADAMHTQDKTAEAIQKKTLITSSRSRTINQTSAKPLSKKLRRSVGHYHSLLRTLNTGE